MGGPPPSGSDPAATAAEAALETALEAAGAEIAEGRPSAALARLAPLLEAPGPRDPRLGREAVRALAAALTAPGGLADWDPEARRALHARLLALDEGPDLPPTLAHALAGRVTGDDAAGAAALAEELAPAAEAALAGGDPGRGTTLFLLAARPMLGERIGQDRLRGLHLARFPGFEPGDLALPYSTLFDARPYGRNRDELLARYAGEAGGPGLRGLPPAQLLLLEHLSGRALFSDPDNGDLLAALEAGLAALPGGRAPREADLAPARSLIARHWRPGGALDAASLSRLGLSPDLLELAGSFARARAALPGGGPDAPRGRAGGNGGGGDEGGGEGGGGGSDPGAAAARRLEGRGWRAARALQGRAARLAPLPLPALGRRRPRVALCVSGQLRGWRAALESWRRSLLTGGAEIEVFVHAWTAVGRAGAQPHRHVLPFEGARFTEAWRRIGLREGYAAMRARQPALLAALEAGGRVTEAEIAEAYGAREAVLEDDAAPEFAAFSNQDKMHWKIYAAHRLAREAGARDGGAHDLVVRIRPDLEIRDRAFAWDDLLAACRARPRLYAERAPGVHFGHLMIGDQFAVAAPEAMDLYAGTWRRDPEAVAHGLAGPEALRGHASLARTCWLGGLDGARAPLRFGPLRDPAPLSAAEIRDALAADAGGRDDALDRELIAANRADLPRRG